MPSAALKLCGAEGVVQGVTFTADEAVPVPAAFVAVTVMAYCVPFARPVTVMGLLAPVAVTGVPGLGGVAVTVYPVTGLPPSEEGGEKETVACESPEAAETLWGAEGVVWGVAATVAEGPVPAALIALTANVYAVPSARPVKVYVIVPVPIETLVHMLPPSEDT